MSWPTPMDPHNTYLHVTADGRARPIEVDSRFWSHTVQELGAGRLLTAFRCDRDWDHWEMHPAGDEVVIVLSGSCDFVLDHPELGERRTLLSAGRMLVVPGGIWHRLEVIAPVELLLLTAGEGTQHRPV